MDHGEVGDGLVRPQGPLGIRPDPVPGVCTSTS